MDFSETAAISELIAEIQETNKALRRIANALESFNNAAVRTEPDGGECIEFVVKEPSPQKSLPFSK